MVVHYILLLFIYSFVGWLFEILIRIIEERKIINRGFLIGPYCPIWGFGVVLMTIFLQNFVNEPVAFILLAMIVAGILEYITSYIMEKLFKAKWWDYSKYPFNLNGRITLQHLLFFGVAGYISVAFTNSGYFMLFDRAPQITLNIIAISLIVIFMIDIIFSYKIIVNLKKVVGAFKSKDNTEEISKMVREVLLSNKLYLRLFNSYPNLKSNFLKKKQAITDEIKKVLNQ